MTSVWRVISGAITAFAQTPVATPSSNISASGLPGNPIALDQLFANLLKDIFIGLALVAFLALLWSGVMYITAGGDAAKAEKARKSIMYTLLGVVLAMLAYGIVVYVTKTVSTLNLGSGGTANSSSATTAKTTNPKIGTKLPDGSYYDPCVTETAAGCVDSLGAQTGIHSVDAATTGSASGSGGNASVAGGNYGLGIVDSDNTLSGDTVTITDPKASFNHPYGLSLNSPPAGPVTVSITKTGALGLRLSDSSYTFTPDNYNQPQGLNISYAGGYKSGDSATVTIKGNDGSIKTIKFIIR